MNLRVARLLKILAYVALEAWATYIAKNQPNQWAANIAFIMTRGAVRHALYVIRSCFTYQRK